MRVTRIYTAQPLHVGAEVQLDNEQAHYLAHVLRRRVGDNITLFNGDGNEYVARLEVLTKKQAVLQVLSFAPGLTESGLEICLGIGISRGQHMDFALQKAVELGVQRIVPVLSEFSNVKIKEDRVSNKMTHWQGIIIHATEQCGRTQLAELTAPLGFEDFLREYAQGLRILLHPVASQVFADIAVKPDNVILLTGPEGGFSDSEVDMAQQQGFRLLRFGPRILRAETAVVAAVATCQSLWGDLGQ